VRSQCIAICAVGVSHGRLAPSCTRTAGGCRAVPVAPGSPPLQHWTWAWLKPFPPPRRPRTSSCALATAPSTTSRARLCAAPLPWCASPPLPSTPPAASNNSRRARCAAMYQPDPAVAFGPRASPRVARSGLVAPAGVDTPLAETSFSRCLGRSRWPWRTPTWRRTTCCSPPGRRLTSGEATRTLHHDPHGRRLSFTADTLVEASHTRLGLIMTAEWMGPRADPRRRPGWFQRDFGVRNGSSRPGWGGGEIQQNTSAHSLTPACHTELPGRGVWLQHRPGALVEVSEQRARMLLYRL
jgi:hypothetical protein